MKPWSWDEERHLWINSDSSQTITAEGLDTRRCDRIAYLEADIAALRERAERVQEGEEWDLAEFILSRTG